MARKVDWEPVSRRAAPPAEPAPLTVPSTSTRPALALELATVGQRPAQVAGQHRDAVGDVGRHAPVARRQQRREGDQRAAAGDRVDAARREGRPAEQGHVARGEVRHYPRARSRL